LAAPRSLGRGRAGRSAATGRAAAAAALLALLLGACALEAARAEVPAGEALYRHGILPSGEAAEATRSAGAALRGGDAACANCHRRSGLGSSEGKITIPPIAGPYLFAPRGKSLEALGVPFVDTMRINHEAYTEQSLARAIRDGLGADGRPLDYLMPRYRIDDAAMSALIEYLKGIKVDPAPGVTSTLLHFATIITPDADPVKRRGMLAVMNQYFVDKNNAAARTKAPTLYSSHTTMFRVQRRWQLHVWELTGAPSGWGKQLRAHLAAEPVFAVISGLGGSHWEPVQRFCEEERLPCLFPNVEAPSGDDADFYSVYFSRGVLLEAQLIAQQLADPGEPAPRVVQIFRAGDVGEAAAKALQAARAGSGQAVVNRALPAHRSPLELAGALRGVGTGDALVLWLRPEDLRALDGVPARPLRVWISGEMGGLEQAPLPAAWRTAARIAYPVDLPGQRVVRVDYALSWFRLRKIPLLAEQVQADTYLACGLVSETLNHIVDAFVRDYLIERIEMALDHRALTGYYPRLSLAPGQRFASKGGYIVRFAEPEGTKLVPVGDWITP
jgi:Cytochrome c